MPHYSEKHCAYWTGSLCVTFGFISYIVAFGVPAWKSVTTDTKSDEVVLDGLWQHTCNGYLFADCRSYSVIMDEPLFQASRSVACIALVLYSLSVFLLVLHNCTSYARRVQTENKIVSGLPLLAGLCGGTACGIYLASIFGPESKGGVVINISWALGLGIFSNALVLLGGIMMLVGSHKDRQKNKREMETTQDINVCSPQTPTTPTPMALIAVPVSLLTSSGSQTNIPMALVATTPEQTISNTGESLSGTAQNYAPTTPVQSPPPTADETPRPAPSAPPPEFHDFYY